MASSETPGESRSPRWTRLVHQADDPIYVLNARQRIVFVNPAWELATGLPLAEVRGQPCRAGRGHASDAVAAILKTLSPRPEALAGMPSQVRRRGWRSDAPWLDIAFLPWTTDGTFAGLIGRIRNVTESTRSKSMPLPEALVRLRQDRAQSFRLDAWESELPAMRLALAQARLAAETAVPVRLIGPPGAGKEWLARAIHQLGSRRDEFFAAVDARRLTPNLLANLLLPTTHRRNLGAILVKHPGDLRPDMQIRFAEVLEQHAFAPRLFVSMTDENALIAPDLLARVSTIVIRVPSLRERRDDWPKLLPDLLSHASRGIGKSLSLAADAERTLRSYPWPGNFRELLQTLQTAGLRADGNQVGLNELPLHLRESPPPAEPTLPLDDLLTNSERRLIQLALDQSRQNKSQAAKMLGVSRPRLDRRIEQLGIHDPSPPGGDDAQR